MLRGEWVEGTRWEQEPLGGCSIKEVNSCEAEENQETVLFWKPREESVSRRLSHCAECCWETRKSGDQELTPRINSMEVTDGLGVSGFQGMMGLGEWKEEK